MTIANKFIIKKMLKNDGIFPGDPQMYSIYSYVNAMDGKTLFAIFMENFHFDLDISPYVKSFELLWQKGGGLTEAGKLIVNEVEE